MLTELTTRLRFRKPVEEDGAAIWSLVRDTGVLDVNSSYCYLMLCKLFADTCVVAERGDSLVGFTSALRPADRPDTLFVWQVAVAESERGNGVASALLQSLVSRTGGLSIRFVEASIAPSNVPSQRLFHRFSRSMQAACTVSPFLPAHLFPTGTHEDERLYRIGPILANAKEEYPHDLAQ